MTTSTTGDPVYVQALALGLDPAWRRRSRAQRCEDGADLAAAFDDAGPDAGVREVTYSSVGLEPGVDLLLWRTASSIDALEESAAALLRSGLGCWLSVTHSLLGRIGPSQYAAKPVEEPAAPPPQAPRYLVVYPFTKTTEWYLLPKEARQGVMNEHMRVGRGYPTVQQLLAYSFGLDGQDFVVAYLTDDLMAFGDLVRDLRGTESRRSTVNDQPILLGVQRDVPAILRLIGAA